MRVRRIGYVSKRTEDVEAMTSFFRDVIGLESPSEGETSPFQRLPTHRPGSLEVYAREHRDARLIPDDADLVIAFVVDDIQEAMVEVQAAGVDLVGDPVWAAEAFGDPTLGEFGWFFVRAPDGRVFAIEQVPD